MHRSTRLRRWPGLTEELIRRYPGWEIVSPARLGIRQFPLRCPPELYPPQSYRSPQPGHCPGGHGQRLRPDSHHRAEMENGSCGCAPCTRRQPRRTSATPSRPLSARAGPPPWDSAGRLKRREGDGGHHPSARFGPPHIRERGGAVLRLPTSVIRLDVAQSCRCSAPCCIPCPVLPG